MAMKRFPLEKYATLELNHVEFARTGNLIAQTPLGEEFTAEAPCENGMWVCADRSKGVVASIEDVNEPIGVVYTAEKEYDMYLKEHDIVLEEYYGVIPSTNLLAIPDEYLKYLSEDDYKLMLEDIAAFEKWQEELAKLPQENIVIALHSNSLYRKTGDIYRLTEAAQFTPRPRSDKQARGNLQIADPYLMFSVTENVDLQSAEYLGSYHFYEARQVAQLLPVRRTWYNYALMPLQAIGYVADVPLSIVTMTLTLPFAGVISPHLDYTTTNQPERSDSYIAPWNRCDN